MKAIAKSSSRPARDRGVAVQPQPSASSDPAAASVSEPLVVPAVPSVLVDDPLVVPPSEPVLAVDPSSLSLPLPLPSLDSPPPGSSPARSTTKAQKAGEGS